jgi:putative glutamine amidotransferase
MSSEGNAIPRIGVPYRTRKEELTGPHAKLDKYLNAVRLAGGDPVTISLESSVEDVRKLASTLDAVVLSGSPADVDPSRFGASRDAKCAEPDADRERVDFALLEHCFAEQKPVLAICFGIQSLNVFLFGTLIQDIPSELGTPIDHDRDEELGSVEAFHSVQVEPGSKLAQIAGKSEALVNSTHHQSIGKVGRNLRVTSRASDGVIEAVEWTGDANWVVGVQWHPERMVETDALSRALFHDLVSAAATRKTLASV